MKYELLNVRDTKVSLKKLNRVYYRIVIAPLSYGALMDFIEYGGITQVVQVGTFALDNIKFIVPGEVTPHATTGKEEEFNEDVLAMYCDYCRETAIRIHAFISGMVGSYTNLEKRPYCLCKQATRFIPLGIAVDKLELKTTKKFVSTYLHDMKGEADTFTEEFYGYMQDAFKRMK